MGKTRLKYDPLERMVMLLGLLVILALMGYLAFQWAANERKRPRLSVHSEYLPNSLGQVYRVEVGNTGDITAQAVKVKLGLFRQGKPLGTMDLDIQYIPAKSRRTAWITLRRKKGASDSLRVMSIVFLEP